MDTQLTPRQIEILEGAALGERVAETALRLWISPETVKQHRTDAFKRIGARHIAEAVSILHRDGHGEALKLNGHGDVQRRQFALAFLLLASESVNVALELLAEQTKEATVVQT